MKSNYMEIAKSKIDDEKFVIMQIRQKITKRIKRASSYEELVDIKTIVDNIDAFITIKERCQKMDY